MGSQPLENDKYEQFCQLINNGESAPQAYVIAGFSPNGADQGSSRLLKRVEVCSRLAFLRKLKADKHAEVVTQAIEEVGVNKKWILGNLAKIVEMGMAIEPVKDKDGAVTGEYKAANLPAANKALELLGIEEGLFIKKIETGKPGDFERLSDDELDRQLELARRAQDAARSAISRASSAGRAEAKEQ